ncbi:carbohydrate kinase family protein [Streptomyces sp. NPDC094149]|uniref:carbohydrate kinase family protein n=1 Tax=Streptomyces sp. NPDC094149 TaxID=3155079 RepID=UPI0033172B1F
MHTFDLLVIGDANPDVILGPLDAPLAFGQREQLVSRGTLTLGGSGAIVACGAASLGLRVGFIGRVGDDDAGRYVRDALAAHGVNTRGLHLDPEQSTPLTVILTRDQDRAIITAPGTLAATTAEDIPQDLLTSTRHVHTASYFLMPQLAKALPDVLRTAREHGATTSLDTNDDPAGAWDPAGMNGVLRHVDYLLPNAAEAQHLAGLDLPDAHKAAETLAARGPVTVVKMGAEGALCHDGTRLLTTDGIPVQPADAVGAGDSFDAGFIVGMLFRFTLAEALQLAAACGALSTRAHGGTTAQPNWDEVRPYITSNGKHLT